MITSTVPPRVARVACEEAFGEKLRALISQSGVSFTAVAAESGIKREDLYAIMDGTGHFRAAWLECLPAAVELLYLAERAREHTMELRPIEAPEVECSLRDIVHALGGAMVQAASGEADGFIDPAEAQAEMDQWWLVEKMLKARKVRLRAAGAR